MTHVLLSKTRIHQHKADLCFYEQAMADNMAMNKAMRCPIKELAAKRATGATIEVVDAQNAQSDAVSNFCLHMIKLSDPQNTKLSTALLFPDIGNERHL